LADGEAAFAVSAETRQDWCPGTFRPRWPPWRASMSARRGR